jgi:hypothetical protein
MLGSRLGAALAVVLFCGASLAHGQRATERYIPLGQSPGVSGKQSTIGTIAGVAWERRQLELAGPDGLVRVRVEESTRIWIDRHRLGQSTVAGTFEDLREGRRAEVKYADPETRQVAEWVKVESEGP